MSVFRLTVPLFIGAVMFLGSSVQPNSSSPENRDQRYWRFLGPSGVPDGEGFNGSAVSISGRITSLVIDRTLSSGPVLFAGAANGGVWRSRDFGRNWEATSDFEESLAIGALA